MPRSRKFDEELAVRKRPSAPVDQASEERSLADETLRLQERIGNAGTTAVIARSALQREETATEAEPMKGGEEEKGTRYTMTMSDIGTFDLESFSWGAAGSGRSESGTTGKGKAQLSDLHATKKGGDEISTKLMQHSAEGRHIATVELLLKKDGKTYMTITLKDAVVTSFQMGGGSGGAPIDSFSLAFAEIEYKFTEDAKK